MAALIPQFKIKHGLEQREFVRVVHANFFEAGKFAKHKMPHVGERPALRKSH